MKKFITVILILAVIGFPMIGFLIHRSIPNTTKGEDIAIVMTTVLGVIVCALTVVFLNKEEFDI